MNVTRTARNTSAAVVAGIAGYASYWHQVAVATSAGERAEIAHVIPLSVDGMLVVASIVMVDDRQQGRKPRWSARIAFLIGTLATIGANVAGAHPTLMGRTVAAWPALALLLVVEMLSRKGKQIPGEIPTAAPTPQSSSVVPVPVTPAVATPVTPSPVVTAAEAITASALPAPVSPAPAGPRSPERVAGTAPTPRRESRSPLTGRVLQDRPPRV